MVPLPEPIEPRRRLTVRRVGWTLRAPPGAAARRSRGDGGQRKGDRVSGRDANEVPKANEPHLLLRLRGNRPAYRRYYPPSGHACATDPSRQLTSYKGGIACPNTAVGFFNRARGPGWGPPRKKRNQGVPGRVGGGLSREPHPFPAGVGTSSRTPHEPATARAPGGISKTNGEVCPPLPQSWQ
jgi:hypothetical protein